MTYSKLALLKLEKAGYKITKPRTLVAEALSSTPVAVSPYDLQKIIREQAELNHVTIYRVLELFLKLHLVHKTSIGAFIKCTLLKQKGCHHFLVCQKCGNTKEFIEENHEHMSLPVSLKKEFKVLSHTFELSGLCKKCFK
jgi:Fe2+ or Zn2+ uptake regulation protein